jgi:hypothetical protein
MVIPPEINSPGTWNTPEEWKSAGNHRDLEADSGWQDQNARKILKTVTILGSKTPNPLK